VSTLNIVLILAAVVLFIAYMARRNSKKARK